jgi:hypothetical protein
VLCGAYCTSRRIRWSHAARDLSTALTLNDGNDVLALQIQPELGTISKISTEPDGCISSDRPASIEYVRDATGRYAQKSGQRNLKSAKNSFPKEGKNQAARRHCTSHAQGKSSGRWPFPARVA